MRGALLGVGLIALSGCSPLDQGALTLDDETQAPTTVVALCDDEVVRAVTLYRLVNDDEREPIWRIEGRSASGETFTATVGMGIVGFTEAVRLSQPLRETDHFMMLTDTSGGRAAASLHVFDLDQLEVGQLYDGRIDSEDVSVSDLQSRADRNCGGLSEQWAALPLALRISAIGVVAFGVVSLARKQRRPTPSAT
jgi:hypothetical protein